MFHCLLGLVAPTFASTHSHEPTGAAISIAAFCASTKCQRYDLGGSIREALFLASRFVYIPKTQYQIRLEF